MNDFRGQQGFTLFSCLAGISIASLGFFVILAAFKSTLSFGRFVTDMESSFQTTARVKHFLSLALLAVDSNRLISSKIHTGGEINYSDGSINAVYFSRPTIRPSDTSDAITAIETDLSSPFSVKRCAPSGKSSATYSVCQSKHLSFFPASSKTISFAGLSPDGTYELGGEKTFKARCGELSLKLTKSMALSDPSDQKPCFIRLLYPITRHFTLYVSASGELRYLSHKGETNIENQPVTAGVRSLKLRRFNLSPGLEGLVSDIATSPMKAEKATFNSYLAREPLWNLLLNPKP